MARTIRSLLLMCAWLCVAGPASPSLAVGGGGGGGGGAGGGWRRRAESSLVEQSHRSSAVGGGGGVTGMVTGAIHGGGPVAAAWRTDQLGVDVVGG